MIALGILSFILSNIALAQLGFDKTRLILDKNRYEIESLNIINESKTEPYLAQTWIEDSRGQKVQTGLVSVPVLQRLDPQATKLVNIRMIGDLSAFPKDRESLLTFNLLPIPIVRPNQGAEIEVVLQTALKLFYRPEGLKQYAGFSKWANEVTITKNGSELLLENPTQYHVVVKGFSGKNKKLTEISRVLKPFGSERISYRAGDHLNFHIINDYGLMAILEYRCGSANGACRLIKGINVPDIESR